MGLKFPGFVRSASRLFYKHISLIKMHYSLCETLMNPSLPKLKALLVNSKQQCWRAYAVKRSSIGCQMSFYAKCRQHLQECFYSSVSLLYFLENSISLINSCMIQSSVVCVTISVIYGLSAGCPAGCPSVVAFAVVF